MIEAYEAKNTELRSKIELLSKKVEHLKNLCTEKEKEQTTSQNKVAKLNEEISQLTYEKSNITKELTSLRTSYKQKEKTVSYLEEQVKQFSGKRTWLKNPQNS